MEDRLAQAPSPTTPSLDMCLETSGCGGSKDSRDSYSLNLCDAYTEVVSADACYVSNTMDLKFDEARVWNPACLRHGTCRPGVEPGELKYAKWSTLQKRSDLVTANFGFVDCSFRSDDSEVLALWEEQSEKMSANLAWQKPPAESQSPWRGSVSNAVKKIESLSHAWGRISPNHPKAVATLVDPPRSSVERKKAGGRSPWRDFKIMSSSSMKDNETIMLSSPKSRHSKGFDRNIEMETLSSLNSELTPFRREDCCESQSDKSSSAPRMVGLNLKIQSNDKEERSLWRATYHEDRLRKNGSNVGESCVQLPIETEILSSDPEVVEAGISNEMSATAASVIKLCNVKDKISAPQTIAAGVERSLSRRSTKEISTNAGSHSMVFPGVERLSSRDEAMLNEYAVQASELQARTGTSHFPEAVTSRFPEICDSPVTSTPTKALGPIPFQWEKDCGKSQGVDSGSATSPVPCQSVPHIPSPSRAAWNPKECVDHHSGNVKPKSPTSILYGPDDGLSLPSSNPSLISEYEAFLVSGPLVPSLSHSRTLSYLSFDSFKPISPNVICEEIMSPKSSPTSPLHVNTRCNSLSYNQEFDSMRKYLSADIRQEADKPRSISAFGKFCRNGKRWVKSKTHSSQRKNCSPEVLSPSREKLYEHGAHTGFSARLGNDLSLHSISRADYSHVEASCLPVSITTVLRRENLRNPYPSCSAPPERLSPVHELLFEDLEREASVRRTRKMCRRRRMKARVRVGIYVKMRRALRKMLSRFILRDRKTSVKAPESKHLYHA
ncbi:uncharacterized protein [Physcomitrium patens]|uniref:Uncharacterized protein n=1 Tax=Physcomitrium patens TaxID=3218 RepID=A9SZ76_PHYPA|nr:uncharacterized protein LOC112279329 [Physcomitrium patens]PNR57185.1 hypothetical protein PHYPA_004178 [Physcomitrium patens]|eukprot:XP_024369443.1 uncharacterized protein LOC112279329 [Physcomitrella patens]